MPVLTTGVPTSEPFEPHAASMVKRGEKQDYERNIVQQGLCAGPRTWLCPGHRQRKQGTKEGEPPEDRYLAEVMLPEMRHCKRHDGN